MSLGVSLCDDGGNQARSGRKSDEDSPGIRARDNSLDERGLGVGVGVADPDDEREPADGDGGLGLASRNGKSSIGGEGR